MTFQKALDLMREGKRVKRPCWTSGFIFIGKETDEPFTEYLYYGDKNTTRTYKTRSIECVNILSDDWVVVD